MAWETRRGHTYYYRKERRGDRVHSHYRGNSPAAHRQADDDADQRRQAALAWAAETAARRTERHLAHLLDHLADQVGALLVAHLLLNGCHTHRRQWRRNRVPTAPDSR
jgi:hypothetical protein